MAKRLNLQSMLREIKQDVTLKHGDSDRLTQSEIRKIFARKKDTQRTQ